MALIVLDELGYLLFSQAGGALLFHLPTVQALGANQYGDMHLCLQVISYSDCQSSELIFRGATP
jgi:hypothetical protein